ncbi:NADPH-dependent F420 reductase [Paenarthrobacter sp. PH39-S1]|uniref:NADPH-dependent F420 reductase n=1 Tax=Micrococcaceae TaxID=1268 RepID=UPI0024BA3D1C|nr:NAD(P)-binding domain-containing protein [Paenarthrobacter sp. PH39-S1]MDJ0356461.1 NAD(P)-binding domain-containing protein [Paenarthrobacter sp. PH39-S1]
MKIAVLGTGPVGRTLGSKFTALGHTVAMGSRDAANPTAAEWVVSAGAKARAASFSGAAEGSDVIVNATAGASSLLALNACGARNLAGKVLIDVANALDFSAGFPPSLSVLNTDSLAESIQRVFPDAMVVKTLNTMAAPVMVDPQLVAGGDHDVFLAGNDDDAKAVVVGLLQEIGWQPGHIRDLGGLDGARGMEMYLPLWLRLMGNLGHASFNFRVVS